jgi:hypothetical protein
MANLTDSDRPVTPDYLTNLRKRIGRDRLDRRMTWPEYAQWMGVKQSTLYKIWDGRTARPHELTVQQIEDKLKEPN